MVVAANRTPVGLDYDHTFSYFLFPPMEAEPVRLPNWKNSDDVRRADAILLTRPTSQQAQIDFLGEPRFHLKPIISLFAGGPRWIDGEVQPYQGDALAELMVERLPGIIRRICELPLDVRESRSPVNVLLSRLYTRAIDLTACYDANTKSGVSYPALEWLNGLTTLADQLTDRALLTRKFFDRMHVCPKCHSSRLNVREECLVCRSPALVQEPTIHHFKCGHIGRESAFRDLGRFNCPKCKQDLRHAGLDYRKPGSVLVCLECGAMNDAATVGFACMDCGEHSDGQEVPTRDWYHYSLTGSGMDAVLHGRIDDDERSELPADLRFALRHAMARSDEMREDYALLRVECSNAASIARASPLQWTSTKNLLHDCLASALRRVDTICEHNGDFLCLLAAANPTIVKQVRSDIISEANRLLKHDPGIVISQVDRVEQRHLLRIEN